MNKLHKIVSPISYIWFLSLFSLGITLILFTNGYFFSFQTWLLSFVFGVIVAFGIIAVEISTHRKIVKKSRKYKMTIRPMLIIYLSIFLIAILGNSEKPLLISGLAGYLTIFALTTTILRLQGKWNIDWNDIIHR